MCVNPALEVISWEIKDKQIGLDLTEVHARVSNKGFLLDIYLLSDVLGQALIQFPRLITTMHMAANKVLFRLG